MTTLPTFTFAYQPIVDAAAGRIVSYEALVRGPSQESAVSVLSQLAAPDVYVLDRQLGTEAVRLACEIGNPETLRLNLNMMPGSMDLSPTIIESTLQAATERGLPPSAITFEITESEIIDDIVQFVEVVNEYRGSGVHFSIDDFGAGYAGLNLLAEFQPDSIKLDFQLVRGIESRGPRQAIVRGVHRACADLGIDVVAEGVETEDEYWWFRNEGIDLFQGFLFAPPAFRELPSAEYPIPI